MDSSGADATHDCNERLAGFARAAALLSVAVLAGAASAQPLEREPWEAYAARRHALADAVERGAIVLFGLSAAEGRQGRGGFHQENNFYYLTGCVAPGAAVLIEPASKGRRYRETLYLPAPRSSRDVWDGPALDPDAARSRSWSGFVRVRPSEDLAHDLERAQGRGLRLRTLFPIERDDFLGGPEPDAPGRLREMLDDPELSDVRQEIARLRAVKTSGETALIEQAVRATQAAHRAAWGQLRPGLYEHQLFAPMSATLLDRGCARTAYPPIVGSGPGSVVLHYAAMARRMEAGDVVLTDVGGEYSGYAADITRTLPVAGRFTERQRQVYDWVLGAQQAVIDAVRPGMRLTGRGPGSLQAVAESWFERQETGLSAHMPHGVGHHVGLDVHDPAPAGPLQPGMVITVEPGLYFPDEELGVRIEDMLLVTEDGARILGDALPKDPDELERILSSNR